MNPDENNTNSTGEQPVTPDAPIAPEAMPETPVTPEAPATPETPVAPEPPFTPEAPAAPEAPAVDNLDQVAADLANAAPADIAPDTMPTAEQPVPEAPVAPESPAVDQPTPEFTPENIAGAVPDMSAGPVAPEAPFTPETPVNPEAPVAPEAMSTANQPMPPTAPEAMPEAQAMPEAPAVEQPAPEAPSMDGISGESQTDSYSTTSANFVGDATAPAENSEQPASDEEQPPLVPAEPVPGSIGSALAYSETAPDHAVPVGKPSKFKKSRQPLTKDNIKLLIAIVGGVTLVAVVAVIIFFIINSGSRNSTTRPADNNDNTPTNVVSSLTCTREGDETIFAEYGAVVSGSDQIIVMYSDDVLSSYGSTLTLKYADEETAKSGQLAIRERYNSKITSAGLTEDPFTSSYDTNGSTTTITHQAEADDITSKSAKVLDFTVLRGEPVTDIDTLLETYEADGYTCVEK